MEYRKIQRVGTGTLCISLPKRWANEFGVESGSMMQVSTLEDGSVVINPREGKAAREAREITIDASEVTRSGQLQQLVIGSYLVGNERIRIKAEGRFTPEQMVEYRQAAEQLIGATLVDEDINEAELQVALELNRYSLKELLQREAELVTSLYRPALASFRELNPAVIDELRKLEREADQFYWLAVRYILTTQSGIGRGLQSQMNPSELLESRTVFRCLGNATDYARGIINILEKALTRPALSLDPHLEQTLTSICDMGTAMLKDAVSAVLMHDAEVAASVIDRHKLLRAMLDQFQEWLMQSKYDRPSVILAYHITWALIGIGSCSCTISETAINRALERQGRAIPDGEANKD